MSVDTGELRSLGSAMERHKMAACRALLDSAADEIDALRAENARLREERRGLAQQVMKYPWINRGCFEWCFGCDCMKPDDGDPARHSVNCPVALAERVLAEPVPAVTDGACAREYGQMGHNGCVNGGSASDVAQDGAHG